LITRCLWFSERSYVTGGESSAADTSRSTMERTRWTDERLDERMSAVDENSKRVFKELDTLRDEMRAGFAELHGEISGMRADLWAFQRQVIWIIGGLTVGLLGLLGAFVGAQY
jgi:hypothetical protein